MACRQIFGCMEELYQSSVGFLRLFLGVPVAAVFDEHDSAQVGTAQSKGCRRSFHAAICPNDIVELPSDKEHGLPLAGDTRATYPSCQFD